MLVSSRATSRCCATWDYVVHTVNAWMIRALQLAVGSAELWFLEVTAELWCFDVTVLYHSAEVRTRDSCTAGI